jgi:hypothetical protein
MITEDYVSFEVAKILKERGFNGEDAENCFAFYNKNGEISFLQTFGDIADYYNSENPVIAPTLQMATKWLREVHKWSIQVFPVFDTLKWCYDIYELKIQKYQSRPDLLSNVDYDTYEEACEAALIYCLENLI